MDICHKTRDFESPKTGLRHRKRPFMINQNANVEYLIANGVMFSLNGFKVKNAYQYDCGIVMVLHPKKSYY